MTHAIIASVQELNTATSNQAFDWFMQTCTSERWCQQMVQQLPVNSMSDLCAQATKCWNNMGTDDFIQAFAGHPMIGDITTLRAKYANTKTLASNEQSGTATASDEVLVHLKNKNQAYLDKHGFIFIICASGLSASEMLDELENRLPNDTQSEIQKAAAEQIKITLLRINKALT